MEEETLSEYFLAFSQSGELEQVKEILHENPDFLNTIDNITGNNALHMASGGNHTDVMEFLLSKNIDINIQNNLGESALHRAAIRGSIDAIELLFKSGINPNIKNIHGKTAYEVANNDRTRNVFHKYIGDQKAKTQQHDDDDHHDEVEIAIDVQNHSDDDEDGDEIDINDTSDHYLD